MVVGVGEVVSERQTAGPTESPGGGRGEVEEGDEELERERGGEGRDRK